MSTSYRNIARDLFFRMRALNKAAEQAEREGGSGEAIRWRRFGVEEACMIVFGQGTGVELVKLSIDTHELPHEQAEAAVLKFISEKLPDEPNPLHHELAQRFPLGLPVRDRNGRTGVVVGYTDRDVLVEETIAEEGREPILRQTPIAPEYIAPVYPRPSRYELLAALDGRVLQLARLPTTVGDQEAIARTILALAQARALL